MSGVVVPFSIDPSSTEAQTGRGFTSFKCIAPIEYARRCSRDALIQATLEPEITAIEPLHAGNFGPCDTYFRFAVVTQGRRCAVALTESTIGTSFDPPSDCDAVVAINRASILVDPVKTTARTIWSHRDIQVPPLFSVRVMRKLKASGASGLRLGYLEEELIDEPKRWVDYTLAMACSGSIAVDYRSPLTDDTMVRVNPMQQGRSSTHWLT